MSSHTDLIAALNDVPVSDTERVQPPRHALVPSTGQRKRGLAGGSFSPCPPTLGSLSPQTGPPTQPLLNAPAQPSSFLGAVPGAPPGTGLAF